MPAIFPKTKTDIGVLIEKFDKDFLKAITKYLGNATIPKYMVLESYHNAGKAEMGFPNLSWGKNVEYQAEFIDKEHNKCWGTVLKKSKKKHGFIRYINVKKGLIGEAHFAKGRRHGQSRMILPDGTHKMTVFSDGHALIAPNVFLVDNTQLPRDDGLDEY